MAFTLTNEVEVGINAARRVGHFLQEQLGSLTPNDITYKGEINIVTPIDLEAQRLVLEYLKASFPDHGFLTEEGPEWLGSSTSLYRWIVDPLDGTSNYVSGLPHFCVSLALEISGKVFLGVVYSPILGEMFYAVRGSGAFLNGNLIHVSRSSDLIDSIIATGLPYDNKETLLKCLRLLMRIAPITRTTRCLGAAALDLCYVACGRLDAYWDVELSPWDMSAGSLIIEEAGGRISDINGQPYNHLGDNILASNSVLHTDFLETLDSSR